jgi:L-ascorbate oxidase
MGCSTIDFRFDQITEWILFSSNDAHIFHIHTKSFQALGRLTLGQAQRGYKMPVWRDTIYLGGKSEVQAMRDKMKSLQVDYTGNYVLHCHNFFHENSGMML